MKNFMNIYQEILCIIAFIKKVDDKACVCFFYKKKCNEFHCLDSAGPLRCGSNFVLT
jgi:hypothetical protein